MTLQHRGECESCQPKWERSTFFVYLSESLVFWKNTCWGTSDLVKNPGIAFVQSLLLDTTAAARYTGG